MLVRFCVCAVGFICIMTSSLSWAGDLPEDVARAFGARQDVVGMTLSPDGKSVAYIAPSGDRGDALHIDDLADDKASRIALIGTGKPERIDHCFWVSNHRLVCSIYAVLAQPEIGLYRKQRVVAVNDDGSNMKLLSTKENLNTHGYLMYGGEVIDWLPDEDGIALMSRYYIPDDHTGSHIGSTKDGLGVDRVDTRTGETRQVETARSDAVDYITDGNGKVRVMGTQGTRSGMDTGVIRYYYRARDSSDWKPLGDFNRLDQSGFRPDAVDPDLNVAYGFKKKDGRMAVYSVALDESLRETLVYAHPDVDVDQLIRLGRRRHVVGASYATDTRQAVYFSEDTGKLFKALAKALPERSKLRVADSSTDDSVLLIFAGSDADPGLYYVFDRKAKRLQTFLVARGALERRKLATMKPVQYPAADGALIPGYLTLPPGREDAKGLPAIVLPHGGPSARDEWGFDWLSQFFAARGFAVLQPNFRGSSGYGDQWFKQNGFQSWNVAIGDVLSAGHWLVEQGIADPGRLGIVGWSYGGYAALQSAVVEPGLFKAVVAIAPVTDLDALKEEHRNWSDFRLVSQFVGSGPHIKAGSPIEHARQFQSPVLLFHGTLDLNVGVAQSRRMAARLKDVSKSCELVVWDGLDHYLDDSSARAQMLAQADAFLQQAFSKAAASP